MPASAVIISDRETLNTLQPLDLGFATIERDNQSVSRRFNDGIQFACDPRYRELPADYVVPFGSDDWADHRLFLEPLPGPYEVHGFQRVSYVNEDATEIAATSLGYEGGCGVRIIPRELVAPLGYRPGEEDRSEGCDTSILLNLKRQHGQRLTVRHVHLHDRQIVDWKTGGEQIHSYHEATAGRNPDRCGDPFAVLAEFYPAEALEEMQAFYDRQVAYA